MKNTITALLFALLTLPMLASAVGVSNPGVYKPYTDEETPADPEENVRIVPPPTGGYMKVRVWTNKPRYHVGEKLELHFSVNRDSHVFVFNTDSAGLTHLIFPNYYDQMNFLRAGKTYYVPDRGYDLQVEPPAGRSTVTIVAVERDFPFLNEFRRYTKRDPFPAYRDGATEMVREIEAFRFEPPATSVQALRPVPKESLWSVDDTTYYVMDAGHFPPREYKVPRYGRLEIDTYPSNARIYIDGEHYGRSPQVIDRLEPGYRHLMLTKEGYVPYECDVYIKANDTKHMDIFLHETPLAPPPGAPDPGKEGGGGFGFFFRKE